MKNHYLPLLVTILSIIGLNAQGITEKHVFSENAKATFKKMTTSESTLDWMRIKESEKVSKEKFLQKSEEIFDLNEKTNFTEIKVNEAKNNWKHHRLQQMYEGIPIEGAHYLLHEKDGLIQTANGHVIAGLELNTTPAISEEVALQMLLNEIGAEKYAWEREQHATEFPKGELVIATTTGELKTEDFALGYKFKVATLKPISHAEYIVDAFTGSLIYKNSLLCQNDVQGTCQTHRYGTQTITMDFDGTDYRLEESVRDIRTYDGDGSNSDDLSVTPFKNPTNQWNNPDHRSGCEAHWVVEQTYDYFKNEHNRFGYDGYGSRVTTWVNVGGDPNNAQGGGGDIYLGEGDGINYGPFTSIDIVAHEFTHSLIQSTANLQYSRESGALNESFADIFGTMVEFYAEPNASNKDWLLGEDIVINGNVFRDMSNPSSKGHPDTYKDDNWYTGPGDNGGVHTNSGVQNHWFYILANGKSGTNYFGYNYNVAGIGMDKAAQLALENLKNYLGPFSDYIDARNGAIEAANALNFTANEKNQVEEAWCAVGLGDCSITTTGTITITSPNGSEILNQGIANNITWNRTGSTGTEVKIEYSINAGNEWQVITESTTNNGTYQWLPPNVETNVALIRVSSLSNETIFDSSDEYFTINACSVKASFDMSNEQPCASETVIFTTTSTGGANTYNWYINGIPTHTGPILYYNFLQAGNYEVELRVTIGNTCGDVEKVNVFVEQNANANFSYNSTSETILFTSPNNVIDATYEWTMGDGESFDTPNVNKSYESAGNYTVCLTVNSSCGSDNHCKNIQVDVYGCTDANACNYDPAATYDDGSCSYSTMDSFDPLPSTPPDCPDNGCPDGQCFDAIDLNCIQLPLGLDCCGNIIIFGCGDVYAINYNPTATVSDGSCIYETVSGCTDPNACNYDVAANCDDGSCNYGLYSDSLALVALYNATDGPNWTNTWDLSQPVNTWYGVTISDCRVTELNLSNNNLQGTIPSELSNLQNLQLLYLHNNSLTGIIPPELGNLQNLLYLSLHSNSLTGIIPVELGNLQNLRYLYLSNNNLTGAIPPELGNLQNLQILSLSDINLTGSIPPELGNLQNLQFLWLLDNNLTGCYPTSLCNLTLYTFSYTENPGLPDNGSDQGFIDFCNGISPCTSTEVYPGDLNFDGITNHKDILSFGIYSGEFGLERDEAYQDINWFGHPSDDWGARQENDSEIKHTDADGNGVVDLRDVEAIEANYGMTHTASSITTPPNNNSNSPIEVTLQASAVPSFIGNDNQVVFDIKVEDVNSSNLALYGGYFTIDYDDAFISDIEVVFNPSWFGTPDQNIEYIVYNDDANNKIDIGITKVDHQNSIGEGTIGQVIATVDNDTPWDAITLNFLVSDIGMQDAESFALPVGASTTVTTFDVSQTDCESSINITSSTSLGNHYAQNLIQTNGNILINNSQDITFGSDRLKVNDGLTVKDGGEFTYFNDPCGTANRGVNTSSKSTRRDAIHRISTVGFYQIDEENLVCNFELNESKEVAIEIVDEKGKTTAHDFGMKQSGTNQIILPNEKLPNGNYVFCLKIGCDRYYTQSVRK